MLPREGRHWPPVEQASGAVRGSDPGISNPCLARLSLRYKSWLWVPGNQQGRDLVPGGAQDAAAKGRLSLESRVLTCS